MHWISEKDKQLFSDKQQVNRGDCDFCRAHKQTRQLANQQTGSNQNMQFRLNDNCDNDQEVHSLFGQVRLACRRACVDSDKIEQSTNSSYKIRSINNDVNNGSHNFISFRKSISNYNNFNVFNNIHLMGIVLLLVTIICSIATPNGQLMSIGPQIKVANALQIKTPAVNIQQHDVKLDEQPLPYWFSFDWFTKKYEKVYTSIESSLRRSLFIGKCVQVFKNKIQFRLGLCTHEEGINQFSDWVSAIVDFAMVT